MIPKIIEFPDGVGLDGEPIIQPLFHHGSLIKTAAQTYHPAIQSFIAQHVRPHPDHAFVLLNAVSDGRIYGSNINGDFFNEDGLLHKGLDYGHETFLTAGIFRHHQNGDPERSLGKVVFSFYNPRMHRVELIQDIFRPKAFEEGAADLLQRIDAGDRPPVSMGCRVPGDYCSWCGHYSRTRSDYCCHALLYMNHVATPDLIRELNLNVEPGQKMYVINTRPTFFDISYVLIGADQTSYAIKKVASGLHVPARLSSDLAYVQGMTAEKIAAHRKYALQSKAADILKQVPAMTAARMQTVQGAEPRFSGEALEGMARYGPQQAMSTCSGMGIVLTPSEFQHLLLAAMGQHAFARELGSSCMTFRDADGMDRSLPYGPPNFNQMLRSSLMPMFTARSIFTPVLQRRVTIISGTPAHMRHQAPVEEKVAHPLLDQVAAAYNAYLDELPERMLDLTKVASADPEILDAVFAFAGRKRFYDHMAKYAASNKAIMLGMFPLMYLYSMSLEKRRREGGQLGSFQEFVRKHPLISASVLAGATHLVSKKGI